MASYLGRPAKSRTVRMARLRLGTAGEDEQRGRAKAKKTRSRATERIGELKKRPSLRIPFGLVNPITMQQKVEIDTARKRASTFRRLASLMVLAVAAFVVADPIVSASYRLYHSVIRDQYELYRARATQSLLQVANARMRSELIALRNSRTKQGDERETSLGQKILELEQMIEGVTALGVFHDRKGRAVQPRAKDDQAKKKGAGALAAILNSRELAGPMAEKGDDTQDGVGGAEDPCLGDECGNPAHREDVAFAVDRAEAGQSDSESRDAEYDQAHDALVQRINRFISVLQVLPLGTPVQGRLSSGFGHRRSPFSHGASFHYGVDISLRVGSNVVATGAGRVVKVAHNRTYGTMVDVQHAPGLITRYAHLSKVNVYAGQEVQRGTVIALSGNSGRSTGPHLHYEVRHNGKARNPTPFVQLAGKLSEFLSSESTLRS